MDRRGEGMKTASIEWQEEHTQEYLESAANAQFADFYDDPRWLWEQVEFPTVATFEYRVKIRKDKNGKYEREGNWAPTNLGE